MNKVNPHPSMSNSNDLWSFSAEENITSVSVSSDGNWIVAGSSDTKIYLFEKFDPTPYWEYTTDGMVTSVSISSDGNYIVAGSTDKKIYLFNKSSPTPLWDYSVGGHVRSVVISSDGNYIVGGGDDNHVYLFNKSSSTPLWDYSTGGHVRSVAISSDGSYIAGGSNDNCVYLFNKKSSTPLWNYSTEGDVRSVAMSSDGNYIVGGSDDNRLYLFNKSSSAPLWDYLTGGDIRSVGISSDGAYTVLGNLDLKVLLFFNYPLDHLTLINIEGSSDIDGNFNLIWTPVKNADNYSIYYSTSYIYEVDESVFLLKSNITTNSYSIEEFSTGEYYFKIVAYLKTGTVSSNCILIKIGSVPPNFFDQIFLYVIIPIIIGMVTISSSVGVYYTVRRYKLKKSLFEISKEPGYKTSQELIEEIKEDTPFIRNYLDTNYRFEEVPTIKDYIFSRISSRELQKLDLIELSPQEKKKFILEILNLDPKEREQLIDEMLKKS